MDDKAKLAHLKMLCSTERAGLSAPFLVTLDGESWSMASNGKMLFAWSGKVDGVEPRGDAPKVTREWITKVLSSPHAMTAEELRAWSGAAIPPSLQDCGACKGTGKAMVRHRCNCEHCEVEQETEIDCPNCDGGKVLIESVRYGVIGQSVVNRNYLAMLLNGISGDMYVDVGVDKYDPVKMRGDGWFALLAQVKTSMRSRKDRVPLCADMIEISEGDVR